MSRSSPSPGRNLFGPLAVRGFQLFIYSGEKPPRGEVDYRSGYAFISAEGELQRYTGPNRRTPTPFGSDEKPLRLAAGAGPVQAASLRGAKLRGG